MKVSRTGKVARVTKVVRLLESEMLLVWLGCQAGEGSHGVKGGKGSWCGEGEQDNKGGLRVVRIAKVVRMVRVTAWVLCLTGVSRVVGV